MKTIGKKVTVGTGATEIFHCRAKDIQTLTVRALAALTLCADGGTVDDGIPLAANEVVGFSHEDFKNCAPDELFSLSAVAGVGTSAFIYGFLKE